MMKDRTDLSDQLTVFVLTVGAPSFPECMRRLNAQDSRFAIEVIENVAPMSRALQCMLDRCRTPFFVQVDEDMLLYPHAVRALHSGIIHTPPDVAILTYHLFDPHAARVIYGLKIYRHQIVHRYPYRNIESCEYDQIRRFSKDRFVDLRPRIEDPFEVSELTLGEHDGFWTDRAIFERYLTLERKFRRHTQSAPTTSVTWVEEHATFFLRRFLETGAPLDLYALMGVIAGRLAPENDRAREKDYRDYDRLPGFNALQRFVEEAAVGLDPG